MTFANVADGGNAQARVRLRAIEYLLRLIKDTLKLMVLRRLSEAYKSLMASVSHQKSVSPNARRLGVVCRKTLTHCKLSERTMVRTQQESTVAGAA